MVDVHNAETRSRNMAAIKGKDTKPELLLRKALFARGGRYRLHVKGLAGKPDIVFPKYKAVVFVHGCFWHMHDCEMFVMPKSKVEFWSEKLNRNKKRDQVNYSNLIKDGWRVIVVWECAIKGKRKLPIDDLCANVMALLSSSSCLTEKINTIQGN